MTKSDSYVVIICIWYNPRAECSNKCLCMICDENTEIAEIFKVYQLINYFRSFHPVLFPKAF